MSKPHIWGKPICFRLTLDDDEKFRKAAAEAGKTVSEYARGLVLQAGGGIG